MGVDPEIACGIMGNIGQLWLDGQFNDLQIHVGDFLFDCNRFILCACSKFFQVLLKSEVKGKGEHPIRQVTIRGIFPEIFQLVLKAVYQGEDGLSTENMIKFWHAVHQLEIPVLISKCETFLISHLTVENFVNIYQNALLLKSVNLIKVAHQFVANNLECFKEVDILLQQPASCIEEIIGDDSLVGQSQNHVVEFILKWVNYELCASEAKPVSADSKVEDLSAQTSEGEPVSADSTVENLSAQTSEGEPVSADSTVENLSAQTSEGEPVSADSTVENLSAQTSDGEPVSADSTVENFSAQTSEVTGNKLDSVEVMFQKPRAVFDEDCTRNLSGWSLGRKQSLGTLLKLVTFTEISMESLEMLADDELVMGSKQSRDIVLQAMKLVNFATTSAASPPVTSPPAIPIDTEDTVVFATSGNHYNYNTIYAYSLDTGSIFKFLSTDHTICNIYTYHNKLLCHSLYDPKSTDCEINIAEFPFTCKMSTLGYAIECVQVEDFYYMYLINDMHMYRRKTLDVELYPVFTLPKNMPSPSLAVLKHNILFYNSTLNEEGKQEVYCFNTKSRKHWHIMTCDYPDCDFVTLIHNDQLYVLYGNGVFVDVTNSVNFTAEAFSLPKRSDISKNLLLWDFQFTIYGALVHQDNLVVFGDLNSVSVEEILECKIQDLKAIKFVHLCGLVTKCHPLVIPKQLLVCQV
ncbi:hypothetical protein BsWGS_24002 [Bradybaena similaris]